ncbi:MULTISPECIES: ABC transporter permease [unclassified Mycoplasma]|uniref:ABC transporter permease n=1 Tax=unclassified Mycoplasma TaxID=2683645 RepID=UPI00211C0DB9|nr:MULTISPECIES: ABC transporter permease [unclassified Mycoplasma]UUM19612.1 ABC transporter permease [Mycoplasma sp. 1578d]UUM24582.1 ABC transporter permease [Mycoplasma sp. 3686d]
MAKFWNHFKDKVSRKIDKLKENQTLSQTNRETLDLAPNALLQPFNYKKWKLIGDAFEYSETLTLGNETKPFKEFIHRFSQNTGGVFGFWILAILIILALFVPFFTLDPILPNVNARNLTFAQTDNLGIYHFFGTDDSGRDLWARLWWGLRYSVALSIVTVFFEVIIGVTLGIMMGQFDRFDRIMTFIIKILSVVPTIIILILMTIVVSPSFWVIAFSLSFTSWTGMANQIRAQVKRARNFEWVSASRVLGTPTWKVLKNYVPVILPILITQLVFSIPGVILAETSLAFIGLNIENTATLGNLISDGQKNFPLYLRYVFVPATVLVLITTSIQLIGASVQDSLRRQR